MRNHSHLKDKGVKYKENKLTFLIWVPVKNQLNEPIIAQVTSLRAEAWAEHKNGFAVTCDWPYDYRMLSLQQVYS